MRILITGGAGYIGSVLTRDLLARGHHVKVVDRLVFGPAAISPNPQLEIWHADIRDNTVLEHLMSETDAVVHLAFASNDPDYRLCPDIAKSINLDPLKTLLELMRAFEIPRFVFMSSCSVYGNAQDGDVFENSPTNPLTAYAEHKLWCEHAIAGADLPHTQASILRAATVAGCSPRMRFDLLLNRWMLNTLSDRPVRPGAESTTRPVTTMDDVVSTTIAALEVDAATIGPPRTYNVASKSQSLAEWAPEIDRIARSNADISWSRSHSDARSYNVRTDRLKEELPGALRHDVTKTLKSLRELIVTIGAEAVFKNKRYFNLDCQLAHDFSASCPARRVV